jgi:hypothetical protein
MVNPKIPSNIPQTITDIAEAFNFARTISPNQEKQTTLLGEWIYYSNLQRSEYLKIDEALFQAKKYVKTHFSSAPVDKAYFSDQNQDKFPSTFPHLEEDYGSNLPLVPQTHSSAVSQFSSVSQLPQGELSPYSSSIPKRTSSMKIFPFESIGAAFSILLVVEILIIIATLILFFSLDLTLILQGSMVLSIIDSIFIINLTYHLFQVNYADIYVDQKLRKSASLFGLSVLISVIGSIISYVVIVDFLETMDLNPSMEEVTAFAGKTFLLKIISALSTLFMGIGLINFSDIGISLKNKSFELEQGLEKMKILGWLYIASLVIDFLGDLLSTIFSFVLLYFIFTAFKKTGNGLKQYSSQVKSN